jgi:hypothetical protein
MSATPADRARQRSAHRRIRVHGLLPELVALTLDAKQAHWNRSGGRARRWRETGPARRELAAAPRGVQRTITPGRAQATH